MFPNNNNSLFGNKPPVQNTMFGGSTNATGQPLQYGQTTQNAGNIFGGQTQGNNMFGNQTQGFSGGIGTTQPIIGGQSLMGNQPIGNQSFMGQTQQQQPTLFGQQPNAGTNMFGLPQNQQLQYNQLTPQINPISSCLNDVNLFKEKFNIILQKLQELEKEKSTYTQQSQQQQFLTLINPIGQLLSQIDSKTIFETSQQILAGQKDVAKKLDEYISVVGLVQKIAEDGVEALKKEDILATDFQKAQQTMKESYDSLQGTVRINQQFTVPQRYQEQLIDQQRQQMDLLTNTVDKLMKYYEKQPNMDIDETLSFKLNHLNLISNYLYMLQLKIKNLAERTTVFQTKVYQQVMPDKKIDEFYTIDTHKELLDQIISEDI